MYFIEWRKEEKIKTNQKDNRPRSYMSVPEEVDPLAYFLERNSVVRCAVKHHLHSSITLYYNIVLTKMIGAV